ncbi:SYTL5 [Cordylochernes scorpioides]|uniref:SYTL5 n=1 Tax=Cordylochernes scorpioides TaxID=51811 RepID=A0ABY6KY32_9ARAC|nr:SYTL5 [Cordylochernes scorpioides]
MDFDEPSLLEPLPHNICLRSTRLIKMILQHIRAQAATDRPAGASSPFRRHGSCPVNFLKKHHNVLRALQTLREVEAASRRSSVRSTKKDLPSKTVLTRSTSLPSLHTGYESEDSTASTVVYNAISVESDLWKLGEATPACYHIEREQESQSDIQIDSDKLVPEGDDYRLVFISSPGSSQVDDEDACKDDVSMYSGSTDYAALAENASGIFFMDDMDWDLSQLCGNGPRMGSAEDEMICTVLFSSPLRDSGKKPPSKNTQRKSSLPDTTGLIKMDIATLAAQNEEDASSKPTEKHTHQSIEVSSYQNNQRSDSRMAQQNCDMLCQDENSSSDESDSTTTSHTSVAECKKETSETKVLLQNQLLSCDQLFDSILAEDEEAARDESQEDVIDPAEQGWAGKAEITGMAVVDGITTTMVRAGAPAPHPRPSRHQTSSSGDTSTGSALLWELQEDALISQLKAMGDERECSTMPTDVKVLEEEATTASPAGLTPSSSCLELAGEAASSHPTGCVDLPTSDSSTILEAQSDCSHLNTASSHMDSLPVVGELDGTANNEISTTTSAEFKQYIDNDVASRNINIVENITQPQDSIQLSCVKDNAPHTQVSLIDLPTENENIVLPKGNNPLLETELLSDIKSDLLSEHISTVVIDEVETISSPLLSDAQYTNLPIDITAQLASHLNEKHDQIETYTSSVDIEENIETKECSFSESNAPQQIILQDQVEECRDNYGTSEEACSSTSALEKYFVSFDKNLHSKSKKELESSSVPAGLALEKNDLFYQTDAHTKVFYWNDSENTESSEGEEDLLDEETSSEDEATYIASGASGNEPYYGHMSYSLHTIVEESCEESERESRVATPTNVHPASQLEDYFNHTIITQTSFMGVKNHNKDDCAMSDTYSETSGSVCSDLNDDLTLSEQAASRLEQYFTRGILGGFVYQDEGELSDESGGRGSEMGDKPQEDAPPESPSSVTPQPESEEEENFDTIKRKKPTFECAPEDTANSKEEEIKLTQSSDFSSTESILANISSLFESKLNLSDSESSKKDDNKVEDKKDAEMPKCPSEKSEVEQRPKKIEEPDSVSIKSGYSDEDAAYIMNKLMVHLSETSNKNDSEESLAPTLELLESEIYRLMQTVSPMTLSEPSGSSCGSSTIGSNNSDYGSDTLESAEYTTTDDDDAHAERIGSFRSNNSFTFRLSSLRRNNSDKSRGGESSDSTISEETLYICKQLMSSLKELAGAVTADKTTTPQKLLESDAYSQARTYIRDQIVALMHTVTASRNGSPIRERKQTENLKPSVDDLKIIKEESPVSSSIENLKDSPVKPKSLLNQDSYAEAIIIDDEGISVEEQKLASKSSESLISVQSGEAKISKGKSSNLLTSKKDQGEKSSFKQFNFLPSSLRRMSKSSKSNSIEYLQTATYPLSIMKSHPDLSPKPHEKKNPENRLSFHADSPLSMESKTSPNRKCLSDERMNKSESKCLPLQIWKKPQSSSSSKINDGKSKSGDTDQDEGCELSPSTFNLNAKEKASSENNLFLRDTKNQKKDGKVSTTKSVGNISDLENSGSKSSCRDTGYYSFKSSDDSILSLGDSAASQTSSASLVHHRSPTSTETIPEVEEPAAAPPGALCESLKSKNVSLSSSNIPEQVWGPATKSSTLPSSVKNKFSLPPASTSRFRPFVSSIFSTSGVLRKLAALKGKYNTASHSSSLYQWLLVIDDNSSYRSHSGFKKRSRLPSTGSEDLRTGLGSMPQLTLTDYSDVSFSTTFDWCSLIWFLKHTNI